MPGGGERMKYWNRQCGFTSLKLTRLGWWSSFITLISIKMRSFLVCLVRSMSLTATCKYKNNNVKLDWRLLNLLSGDFVSAQTHYTRSSHSELSVLRRSSKCLTDLFAGRKQKTNISGQSRYLSVGYPRRTNNAAVVKL